MKQSAFAALQGTLLIIIVIIVITVTEVNHGVLCCMVYVPCGVLWMRSVPCVVCVCVCVAVMLWCCDAVMLWWITHVPKPGVEPLASRP